MAAEQVNVDKVLKLPVYASVAREAMLQQEGVADVRWGLRRGGRTNGVKIHLDRKGRIFVRARLILDYGHGAFTLGRDVQQAVIDALAQISKREVARVDLTFSKIRLTRALVRRHPKG